MGHGDVSHWPNEPTPDTRGMRKAPMYDPANYDRPPDQLLSQQYEYGPPIPDDFQFEYERQRKQASQLTKEIDEKAAEALTGVGLTAERAAEAVIALHNAGIAFLLLQLPDMPEHPPMPVSTKEEAAQELGIDLTRKEYEAYYVGDELPGPE